MSNLELLTNIYFINFTARRASSFNWWMSYEPHFLIVELPIYRLSRFHGYMLRGRADMSQPQTSVHSTPKRGLLSDSMCKGEKPPSSKDGGSQDC